MKLLSWPLRFIEWLIDRILDGMRSGPHGPAQRSRGLPERDPGSGRWVSDPADAEYEDDNDEGDSNDSAVQGADRRDARGRV